MILEKTMVNCLLIKIMRLNLHASNNQRKYGDASTISEITSVLTSGFTNLQESIVQGVRNTSTNNDNPATSSKRNSTVTPTQQLKRRKYGAGNEGE